MHSEDKQTETSEFGAEKGLSQGRARRRVGHALKSPELPEGFGQSISESQVKEVGHRARDQIVHSSFIG